MLHAHGTCTLAHACAPANADAHEHASAHHMPIDMHIYDMHNPAMIFAANSTYQSSNEYAGPSLGAAIVTHGVRPQRITEIGLGGFASAFVAD